jgi:hypothetical protein
MPAGHTEHDQDQLLAHLLEICEDFLGHAGHATRAELDAYLSTRNITGGPGWLIDMLGLTRLRLQALSRHRSEPGLGATPAPQATETSN